jgi:A/G-specific adenine glycosylase
MPDIWTNNAFHNAVLDWYQHHGRHHLPWQHPATPYRVWISEIMLQQTQVQVVIPYFERFMNRFPDLQSLSEATCDEVLSLWSGLGYYARARHLHQTAQYLWQHFQGTFPEQREQLQALPGIGRSTAAAILSLAYGQRQTILDGNVKRVLARCFAIPGWPGHQAVATQLWQHAEKLTPDHHVANYNQALMDLGSSICTRHKPKCSVCPLAHHCIGYQTGQPQAYPAPKPKATLPIRQVQWLLIHATNDNDHTILLEQRPPTGIWGGLWSVPELTEEHSVADWCQEQWFIDCNKIESWTPRRHTFSHFHLHIQPFHITVPTKPDIIAEQTSTAWFTLTAALKLGLPAPIRTLLMEAHHHWYC